MWRDHRCPDRQVACIACGDRVYRWDAREYDRYGNRWERTEKTFEYLCKGCHHDHSHQPREDLERILVAVGSDHASPQAFVQAYYSELTRTIDGDDRS